MSQIIQSRDESSLLTGNFSFGATARANTSTQGSKVVVFQASFKEPFVPGQSIDLLAAEWGTDPLMAEELKAARRRLGALQEKEGKQSLRSLRLSRGLTQAELAAAIGLQQPHIARIERGHSCPTFQTCRKIAAALHVDMNTLDAALPSVNDCAEPIA